ncbi:hypothetical protein ACIRYZ_37110 [Kitasatospora sp. NPDC101155]|uniref:hypothetical protein n=1 Tax=Kitasatospora sp. NPDC101155 TaxID=3364097 RepID=UPI0038272F21
MVFSRRSASAVGDTWVIASSAPYRSPLSQHSRAGAASRPVSVSFADATPGSDRSSGAPSEAGCPGGWSAGGMVLGLGGLEAKGLRAGLDQD